MSPSVPLKPTDTADRSDTYLDHLERGLDAVSVAPSLALVTLLTALLGFDRPDDVLVSDEVFSFTLGLPSPTPDLWSFLNVTAQAGVTDGVVRTLGPTGAAVLVVGTVLRSVLGAGLLGLAVLYVAYGTPFIAVTHDYGFRRALARSVSLSGTGPYVAFTVGYALTVLACSPVVSALAYADGVPGVPPGRRRGGARRYRPRRCGDLLLRERRGVRRP